jgi:predicted N-acyltransferase
MLHFELCYYRLIEHAIEQGMQRFEAGAQGSHKLRRGLMPVRIYSGHWLRHPVLAQAVADFLPREAAAVDDEIRELSHHGPFRRQQERDVDWPRASE